MSDAGVRFARELITWQLAEPEAVWREAQKANHQPMLAVATIVALVEALAATFGTQEAWQQHIAEADQKDNE